MNKIKVGVIGCGFVASKWHIPGFISLKRDVVVQAVCDLNPSLASSVAEKFNLPKSYSNVLGMLRNEDLDIVDICTPPHTHAPLAIEAMEKGCHVLLEKPMALNVSDCNEMVSVSKRQGSKLCVVHNELFRPPLLRAKELVEKGDIGKVLGMEWCRFTHREEYLARENHWVHKLPGGVLGETGPHAVYTSLAFLKKINDVHITATNNLKYAWAPYDYFNIIFEGESATSSAIISHCSDNYVADVSIFGTEGILKMDLQNMLFIRHELKETKMVSLALSSLKTTRQILGNVTSNAAKVVFSRNAKMRVRGHSVEIEKFVSSVINDESPPVTAEEGRETIRVMEIMVEKLNQKYGIHTNKSSH
jgi:UDP-N-acetylglucosamine 3-dehydrogenase